MQVGKTHHREVSQLNRELFISAALIMEQSTEKPLTCSHIGWVGVGDFIDWLEKNYKIERK